MSPPTLPSTGSSLPNRIDIERQLDRMMHCETFFLRPKQAEVFAFLVNGTLNGEEMTHKYVREKLFPTPPYDQDSAIARKTIENVRGLIKEYYADDGKEDLVIVSLPKSSKGKRVKFAAGEAYKPSFSYNPRHEAMKQYQLGAFYSRRGGSTDLAAALEHYTNALKIHPGHADALVGMIWVFLGSAWSSKGEEKLGNLADAEYMSNVALEIFPNYWGSHFVRASVLAEKGDLRGAQQAYDISLTVDKRNTLSCARRTPLLRQLGDTLTHLRLTQTYLTEHLNDPDAYIAHGTVLLGLQRYSDAILSAEAALKLDRNYLTAHYLMAACLIHEGRLPEVEAYIERMRVLADEPTFARLESVLRYMITRLRR